MMKNIRGFTLVEMIITVAVLAIVLTMAFPNFAEFFERQRIRSEQNALDEISSAMLSYLRVNNELPPLATWAEDIAQYTDLSIVEIETDTWGEDRKFDFLDPVPNTYRDAQFNAYYAVVRSKGPDRDYDIYGDADIEFPVKILNGVGVDPADPGYIEEYEQYEIGAESDDLFVKITDYQTKVEAYDVTSDRLKNIADALENYSRSQFNQANLIYQQATALLNSICSTATDPVTCIASAPATCDEQFNPRTDTASFIGCMETVHGDGTTVPDYATILAAISSASDARFAALLTSPDDFLFYPASDGQLTVTFPSVRFDTDRFNSGAYTNTVNDITRRGDMRNLMRQIGLPDEYCCSALSLGADGLPEPFYFYSNPEPRPGGSCSGAPPAFGTTPLPPRITTEEAC